MFLASFLSFLFVETEVGGVGQLLCLFIGGAFRGAFERLDLHIEGEAAMLALHVWGFGAFSSSAWADSTSSRFGLLAIRLITLTATAFSRWNNSEATVLILALHVLTVRACCSSVGGRVTGSLMD